MYERTKDESENQYILRICSMKDENGWTWQDIADILNDAFNTQYGESKWRKDYAQFIKISKIAEKNLSDSDEYLKSIDEKRFELEKERQKLYSAKIEMQRMVRQNARFEMFYDNIKDAIEALPMPELKVKEYHDEGMNKEYLLAIADIHAGAKFDLPTNKYSMEECERRFNVLLNSTVDYVLENHIFDLNVVSLGDDIQGILRVSDLQLNETSVVEATVFVSRLIANFLNELSAYCDINYYHVSEANHSQTRPLGTKASEIATEDVEYIIGNYIKDMLNLNNRIKVHTNFGHDFIKIPIYKYNIIAMHGHTISNMNTALKDLSVLHDELIDYIVCGHLHNGQLIPGNERKSYDTEVLMCPSFQGTDPYAYSKLGKSSKAACKMFIFDPVYGCTGTEKFILN